MLAEVLKKEKPSDDKINESRVVISGMIQNIVSYDIAIKKIE